MVGRFNDLPFLYSYTSSVKLKSICYFVRNIYELFVNNDAS